ncbi:hypothetical protein N7539_008208 [Penicillium diatomitis]|uniref:Uncharacterized protein n=1 Tax=Penicillium diatomitis TaxID=2819901 RepID=A0A9W9WTC5_9EURO|nr:uncharacterized protein N7539_008208 [Penicillium diatomitis]KAJ5475142.1 hypothetical protein N7539_008208 [Penicillium diatomitis]
MKVDSSHIKLDNSGNGPLKVPGFNGVPVFYEHSKANRFAHGIADWQQIPQLFVNEVTMLQFMSFVTDQPDWENKMTDPQTLEDWRKHAFAVFDFSEHSWKWCVQELQDKAMDFRRTGRVAAFDVGSRVVKTRVPTDLLREMNDALAPLFAKEPSSAASGDLTYTARRESPVRHVVDPSMHPLVFGHTRVLDQGGQIDFQRPETWNSSNTGIAPIPERPRDRCQREESEMHADERREDAWRDDGRGHSKPELWSNAFQCLPCDVVFDGNGAPKITSYVNGVHPAEKRMYSVFEDLISTALEPWNEMLIRDGKDRTPRRIRTYNFQVDGTERTPQLCYEIERLDRVSRDLKSQLWPELKTRIREYLSLPEPERRYRVYRDSGHHELLPAEQSPVWNDTRKLSDLVRQKLHRLYAVRGVEPGISFTYNEWKTGHNTGRPIMHKFIWPGSKEEPAPPDPDHEYYTVSLQDQFAGLQVIMRVSAVELTPETPFYAGDAHPRPVGNLNEHIVSTAVCYFDMHNIQESQLSFEQESMVDVDDFDIDQWKAINSVHGIRTPHDTLHDFPDALQTLGSILIPRKGQLVAWPNVMRYKAEPLKLADPKQPGRLRFVTLWLVDPHYRICSTKNVPPQNPDWIGPSRVMPDEHSSNAMSADQAERYRRQMKEDRDTKTKTIVESLCLCYNHMWDLWGCGEGSNYH